MYYLVKETKINGFIKEFQLLESSNNKERLEYLQETKYREITTKILKEE